MLSAFWRWQSELEAIRQPVPLSAVPLARPPERVSALPRAYARCAHGWLVRSSDGGLASAHSRFSERGGGVVAPWNEKRGGPPRARTRACRRAHGWLARPSERWAAWGLSQDWSGVARPSERGGGLGGVAAASSEDGWMGELLRGRMEE